MHRGQAYWGGEGTCPEIESMVYQFALPIHALVLGESVCSDCWEKVSGCWDAC